MRLRLINHFLRHGEIHGVRPGTKESDVEKLLGKPKYKDRIEIGTLFWYGSIRILSSTEDGCVWFIEVEPNQMTGLFQGSKSVGILTEGLLWLTPRKQAKALVESHGIKTELRRPKSFPRPEDEHTEYSWLQAPSGALMEFERFGVENPSAEFKLVGLRVDPYVRFS